MQSFDYKKSYGTLIYESRKRKNLTQMKLAEFLETTDKIISKWENEINFPSNKFLLKLCDVLEIEVKELLKQN